MAPFRPMHRAVRAALAAPARVLLALVLLALASGLPARAEKAARVALVIGNGSYKYATGLPNPPNDARAVAAALQEIGFRVIEGYDLGFAEMDGVIEIFGEQAAGAEIALFYYAGHGVQYQQENYLIPVDSLVTRPDTLARRSIDLTYIQERIRLAGARIIFLDACRDLPELFTAEASRTLSLTRGLADPKADNGTFIAYATASGKVALDGTGAHSPFTAALLAHLRTPGIDLSELMLRIRNDVLAATGGRQTPWAYDSLLRKVVLVPLPEPEAPVAASLTPPAPAEPAAPAADPAVEARREVAFWETVQRNGSIRAYESYLRRYPEGTFRDLAELEIDRLRAEEEARARLAATPPAVREEAPKAIAPVEVALADRALSTPGTGPVRSAPAAPAAPRLPAGTAPEARPVAPAPAEAPPPRKPADHAPDAAATTAATPAPDPATTAPPAPAAPRLPVTLSPAPAAATPAAPGAKTVTAPETAPGTAAAPEPPAASPGATPAAPETAALPPRPETPEAAPDPAAAEAAIGLTRDGRRQVQQRLNLAGFRAGTPDGVFGRATRAAIAAWQAARGHAATGFLDVAQHAALLRETEAAQAKATAEEAERARARTRPAEPAPAQARPATQGPSATRPATPAPGQTRPATAAPAQTRPATPAPTTPPAASPPAMPRPAAPAPARPRVYERPEVDNGDAS